MNNPHLTPWGILFYLLAQSLNPNNQLPLLRIDDDCLTGSKVENFQPAAFNGRERGDEIYYYFNDQLGDTTGVSDDSGGRLYGVRCINLMVT